MKPTRLSIGLGPTAGIGAIMIWCLVGLAAGVGGYTFYYAQGASYLSNNPKACANCHVMQAHFDAWIKSSHRQVATCNDCHAPHDSIVAKYACKARNGFFHSFAFTTGRYPDTLRINAYNLNVTEHTCRYCHATVVHQIDNHASERQAENLSCIRCHHEVGHAQ